MRPIADALLSFRTMCGRYALTTPPEVLAELFKLAGVPTWSEARYNIAPSQDIPVVRMGLGRGTKGRRDEGTKRFEEGEREIVPMRWGLIPFWSKDAANSARMINARTETVATKPAYRAPFKSRRAIVPASGFYEWKRPDSPKGVKQPMYIHPSGEAPFAFAALWDSWRAKDAPDDMPSIETATILTCAANELVAPIHDRMPLRLTVRDFDRWLDPTIEDAEELEDLLAPREWNDVEMYPVSRFVNSPRNESKRCIERVTTSGGASTLFDEV